MHRAPGRGIWCHDKSNTNTGHDIPSRPMDAPEHCHRWPEPAAQAADFDSEEAQDTGLEGWSRPGLRGWNYADTVDALGAYTASDTRLSSRLISASGTLSPSVADRYQPEAIGTMSF
jgi:hypothetical protein